MNRPTIRIHKDTKFFLLGLLAVWVIYVLLIWFAPPAESVSRYGLTLTQTQLLRVSFILPYLFIWVTALLGAVWFGRYTNLVKGSAEEAAFRKITRGLWMLLFVIVIPSFISAIANYFPGDMDVQKAAVILRNYTTLSFYLAGFYFLWQASKILLKTVETPFLHNRYQNVIVMGVVSLAVVYTWAVLNNPFRTASTDPLVRATYYLPDILIVLTIVIPYILVWILGITAVLNVITYSKRVAGVIYRETFSSLALGLAVTTVLLICLQFLIQANAALGRAALQIILVIVYVILLAIAVGYLLIARGARKLAVIEEVE